MNKLSVLNCGSLYLILTPNTRHHLTRLSDCRYLVTPKTITLLVAGYWELIILVVFMEVNIYIHSYNQLKMSSL